MKTKTIGLWAFLLGLALSMLTAFFDLGSWTVQVLIVLGILVGLFHPIRKEFVPLGVIYLVLNTAAASADGLYLIGPFITAVAAAWTKFLGPVVLTAFLMWASPYLIAKE